jgi:hypothetical protein
MSPDKKTKGMWLICYAYRNQHKGGRAMCNQIPEKVRENIGKVATTGTCDAKSSSSSSDGGGTGKLRTSNKESPNK